MCFVSTVNRKQIRSNSRSSRTDRTCLSDFIEKNEISCHSNRTIFKYGLCIKSGVGPKSIQVSCDSRND